MNLIVRLYFNQEKRFFSTMQHCTVLITSTSNAHNLSKFNTDDRYLTADWTTIHIYT